MNTWSYIDCWICNFYFILYVLHRSQKSIQKYNNTLERSTSNLHWINLFVNQNFEVYKGSSLIVRFVSIKITSMSKKDVVASNICKISAIFLYFIPILYFWYFQNIIISSYCIVIIISLAKFPKHLILNRSSIVFLT